MIKLFTKSPKLYIKQKCGFTLLEVMMATLIIGIGLVGVSSLIAQNIQVQYINKNVLIASQLAQEGLELVRNVRDENWLIDGNDWKIGAGSGTNSDIVQDAHYAIDYLGSINSSVNTITDNGAKLYINSDYYNHTVSGDVTPFFRLIEAIEDAGGSFLTVICTVRSIERDRYNDYVAETILYNWR